MRTKKAMMFVANPVSNALQEECQMVILDGENEERLPQMSKRMAATRLIERLAARLVSHETSATKISKVSHETRG